MDQSLDDTRGQEHPQGGVLGSLAEALTPFEIHLRETCGLAWATRDNYLRWTRHFLRTRYGESPIDLTVLGPGDLKQYVTQQAEHLAPATVKLITATLRSFLRFLRFQGSCAGRLVEAVPTVACRQCAGLPKVHTDEQVHHLLASFDRKTPLGLRDHAMALCLNGLGLRAGEVAGIALEDIDWRVGTITIARAKPRRARMLPLPVEVGRAVATYLRRGRPHTSERRIFVRHRPPAGPMSAREVCSAIRAGWLRARVDVSSTGTHALRHTMATRLLRSGASLKHIADILGHRHLNATTIYAKVDLARLEEVALSWPEVRS